MPRYPPSLHPLSLDPRWQLEELSNARSATGSKVSTYLRSVNLFERGLALRADEAATSTSCRYPHGSDQLTFSADDSRIARDRYPQSGANVDAR